MSIILGNATTYVLTTAIDDAAEGTGTFSGVIISLDGLTWGQDPIDTTPLSGSLGDNDMALHLGQDWSDIHLRQYSPSIVDPPLITFTCQWLPNATGVIPLTGLSTDTLKITFPKRVATSTAAAYITFGGYVKSFQLGPFESGEMAVAQVGFRCSGPVLTAAIIDEVLAV